MPSLLFPALDKCYKKMQLLSETISTQETMIRGDTARSWQTSLEIKKGYTYFHLPQLSLVPHLP